MIKFATTIIVSLFSMLSIGCTPIRSMPFKDTGGTLVNPKNSLFLLTVYIENKHYPSSQPKLENIFVENISTGEKIEFAMDEKGTIPANEIIKGNTYYIRLELEPGEYIIRGISGERSIWPVLFGRCFLPMFSKLTSDKPGIFYIGHLDAYIREIKDGEFRAGSLGPLIDQAACGFSNGSFDITISNKFSLEASIYLEQFLQLRNLNIQEIILPPVDRIKIQKIWDDNNVVHPFIKGNLNPIFIN